MKIAGRIVKALVAIADGVGPRAFLPGSIHVPLGLVLVTLDFDPRQPPIGRAMLTLGECGEVWADIELFGSDTRAGLTPALGGRVVKTRGEDVELFEVLELSLCANPNQDARIPALG